MKKQVIKTWKNQTRSHAAMRSTLVFEGTFFLNYFGSFQLALEEKISKGKGRGWVFIQEMSGQLFVNQ